MTTLRGTFLVALIGAILLALSSLAEAHDWYTGQSDPVDNYGCCGDRDCAPVPPEWVTEVPEGFRLVMTLEQTRTINPLASLPVDAIIPWNRVQSPPHGHAREHPFHACIYNDNREAPRHGVICFWATPTT